MTKQTKSIEECSTKELRASATSPDYKTEWQAFCSERGVNSANVTKEQLIEFHRSNYFPVLVQEESAAKTRGDNGGSGSLPLIPVETKPVTKPTEESHDNNRYDGMTDDERAIIDALRKARQQSVDEDKLRAIVEDMIAKAMEGIPTVRIELQRQDGTTHKVEGHQHPKFTTLLRCCSSKLANGHHPNVWIAGPTGSGKTHAAEQVAHALGLDFGFHGAMTMAHELVGFVDGHGKYHETVFVRSYRNGGVCLVDEVDAGDNSALLALNAALANGLISLPNGEIVKRHPDFICIGAANTWGAGATAEFVGRARIDAAFLSRFAVKIAWDYDVALEQAICGNPQWAIRVQGARARSRSSGLKHVIDPRHSQAGAALIAAGLDENEVAQLTYLAGLSKEQIAIVEGR